MSDDVSLETMSVSRTSDFGEIILRSQTSIHIMRRLEYPYIGVRVLYRGNIKSHSLDTEGLAIRNLPPIFLNYTSAKFFLDLSPP